MILTGRGENMSNSCHPSETDNSHDAALGANVDPSEISKFAAMAHEWWDPCGKFKPLHQINPLRLSFILQHLTEHFELDRDQAQPLSALRILDIGCGGGLLAEPLARLGAEVTAVDASARNIQIARLHAKENGIKVQYQHGASRDLVQQGLRFDAVTSMEIIEHVADVEDFCQDCAELVRAGGLWFGSTINRTTKSWLLAIVGAEYLLNWLPKGTHDWKKFLKPSEYVALMRHRGLIAKEISGVAYNPISDHWRKDPKDLDVNYMLVAQKPACREDATERKV